MKRRGRPVRVWAFVALMGKWHHGANPAGNFLAHKAGGKGAVVRYVFPDPDDIVRRKRMEAKALLCAH